MPTVSVKWLTFAKSDCICSLTLFRRNACGYKEILRALNKICHACFLINQFNQSAVTVTDRCSFEHAVWSLHNRHATSARTITIVMQKNN